MARFLKQFEILFKKASVDLKAAQNLHSDFLNGDAELDIEVIFFHLQQAAEKFLKSLLSYNQVNYPKIHDLEELLNVIENNNIEIHLDREKLIDLGDYAVEGRYSVIYDDFEDVKEYFILIEKLKHEIFNIIFGTE